VTVGEDLYERIRGCTLCALSQSRTQAVPGDGPLDADVMFIGEAPGFNEDKQGIPFVGAAGNFLNELLREAGQSRETIYICNVLKCRPPNNRDPMPGEIETCRPYLEEQIELIDPRVIVTLGRFSMSRFFPNHKISQVHGRWKEVDGRFFVPMYHPAAALHQGALRATIVDDFRRLPRVLERARQFKDEAGFMTVEPPSAPEATPEPDPNAPPPDQIRLFD
jgi:DNA polymerase